MIIQRKKLGISQESVAKVLGLTRQTIAKIESGERKLKPSEKAKLKEYFDSISGESAYIRINIPQRNIEKFKQVLLYVLEKVGAKPNVGETVIYKLLYFIDFDYYEKYEKQLMGLTYFKNKYGPAPREFKRVVDDMIKADELEEVRSSYFKHDQKKYLPKVKPDLSVLSGQELELIDSVLERFSDKSAKEMSDITHRDTPWLVAKDKENLEYESAFYRPDEFSVREYDPL